MAQLDIKNDILNRKEGDSGVLNKQDITELSNVLESVDKHDLIKSINEKFTDGLNESIVNALFDGIKDFSLHSDGYNEALIRLFLELKNITTGLHIKISDQKLQQIDIILRKSPEIIKRDQLLHDVEKTIHLLQEKNANLSALEANLAFLQEGFDALEKQYMDISKNPQNKDVYQKVFTNNLQFFIPILEKHGYDSTGLQGLTLDTKWNAIVSYVHTLETSLSNGIATLKTTGDKNISSLQRELLQKQKGLSGLSSLPTISETSGVLTGDTYKKLQGEALGLLKNFPKISFESFAGAKQKGLQKELDSIISQINALPPQQILSFLEGQKSRIDTISNNKYLSPNESKQIQDAFTTLFAQFDTKRMEVGAVGPQFSVEDYLNGGYHSDIFEKPSYQDAYNKLFDAYYLRKDGDTINPSLDNNGRFLNNFVSIYYKNGQEKDFDIKNVDFRIAKGNEDDKELSTYPVGTRVICIKEKDNTYQYIVFGNNGVFNQLKREKFVDQYIEKRDGQKVLKEGTPVLDGTFDISFFKDRGSETFGDWLDLQTSQTIIDNMDTLFTSINKIKDRKENKSNFIIKLVQIICKKSIQDSSLMQSYLQKINPGNNNWKSEFLGGAEDFETQQKNIATLKAFMEANKWEQSVNSAQKEMAAKVKILEAKFLSQNKEKTEVNLLQSVMNILKGDYEHTSPVIKNIFFMVSEFLGGSKGGRKWLFDKFYKNPQMQAKINAFYAKEFVLSNEKKKFISEFSLTKTKKIDETIDDKNINEIFGSEKEGKSNFTLSDYKNKDTEENISGFAPRLYSYLLESKNFNQLDPGVIKYIIQKGNIQGMDKVIGKNEKGDITVKFSEIPENQRENTLQSFVKTLFENKDILKNISETYGKTKGSLLEKDSDELQGTQQFQIEIIFLAYLVSGSKEHFYNVVVENNLITKINKPTIEGNIKEQELSQNQKKG